MAQDLDISNIQPKRDRIRIERNKYDELVAERDRLKAQLEDVTYKYWSWETYGIKCRNQRDMARFLAALLGLAAFGLAVAVWMGRLVPVV